MKIGLRGNLGFAKLPIRFQIEPYLMNRVNFYPQRSLQVKYVFLTFISIVSLPAFAKADWHILNLNKMTCVREKGMNPYQAKQAGARVEKIAEGIFTVSIGGNSMFVGDSREKCEKMKKAISK